ncbi:MAG: cyclic pyranopterin monophosphate synthase MoaC [Solirubrobacteraceae bacterium]
MSELTHLDDQGAARMVDVGGKPETERAAVARATVRVSPQTASLVAAGDASKGDVAAVARIAAIGAAKKTGDLIPLCHPLGLTSVDVDIAIDEAAGGIIVTCETRCVGRTGVEMEAMAGASIGALAVYDMVKGVERGACVEQVVLLEKRGGRSGHWRNDAV